MQVVFKSFLSTEIRNTTVEVDQLVKHYVDHLLIIQVISNPEMVLEPLIRQALNLESEDYLKIPCEDYLKRIEKLKQLVESSGLQKEDKIKLLKLISDHEDQDQRLLLQYATPIEKEEIANAYHDARLSTVMEKIKNGEWDSLLMAYGNDIKFSYVLLAAYSQKMITLDELATAMIFHRAFYNAQTSFHIYPFEGEVKLDLEWDSEKVIGLNQIQVNQRYYVTIDSTAFDAYTKDLFESNFFGLVLAPPGVIKLEKESTIEYGIVSFGIAKAFIPNLKPILHLTPDSETMLKHGLLKFSDFALLFPDEVPNTHGSDDNTIFAPMHDLFHSHHRQKKKRFSSTNAGDC